MGGLFLAGLYPSLDDFSRGNDVRQKTPPDTGDALSQLSVSQFDRQRTEPVILYVVGAVTMLIASLGIYGALKENLVALAVVSTNRTDCLQFRSRFSVVHNSYLSDTVVILLKCHFGESESHL